MNSHKNNKCRFCGSTSLSRFLSLGNHPPSNSFIKEEDIPDEQTYPLDVYLCEKCSLVQLLDVVEAKDIFDNYPYLSSTSKALKNHYASLVEKMCNTTILTDGDVVVDIGCNDGVLLAGYTRSGLFKIGVEPSNVAEYAKEAGFKVYKSFFSPNVARRIALDNKKAKIITATNVFPHVDDISSFTEGIEILLDKDGMFVIEASYLVDLIDQTLFDTIYHEHLCYLSLTPMIPFFKNHGLEIFDAEKVPFGASGPAIRVWVQKKNGPRKISPNVSKMLEDEKSWGVDKLEKYKECSVRVEQIKEKLLRLVNGLLSNGYTIGGYGAPAKGNTLLNYVGFTSKEILYIAENNKLKQGLVTPGSHISIISDEEFIKKMPDYALLLTWNYLDFFLKNSEYIKNGGKFVVPIPEPRVITNQ
jgi:hypothetical protein